MSAIAKDGRAGLIPWPPLPGHASGDRMAVRDVRFREAPRRARRERRGRPRPAHLRERDGDAGLGRRFGIWPVDEAAG